MLIIIIAIIILTLQGKGPRQNPVDQEPVGQGWRDDNWRRNGLHFPQDTQWNEGEGMGYGDEFSDYLCVCVCVCVHCVCVRVCVCV